MNISKISVFSFLVFVSALDAGQQVYQAQAGAVPAQIQQQQPQQFPQQQQAAQGSQPQQQQAQAAAGSPVDQNGVSELSGEGSPKTPKETNMFLEYYSRQGAEFGSSLYVQEASLSKQNISQDDLKKAVVVFFGDWCPHCDSFLKSFSKNVELLRLAGVNVIFINVPSIDRLKNWKEPTVDEFNAAENKIASYGIKLSNKKVFVGLLGDRITLAKSGIEGLPVVIAVKDGREYFRGVGESGVSKLNLSDQAVLKQFLEIWDKEPKETNAAKDTGKSQKSSVSKKNRAHKSVASSKGRKSNAKPTKNKFGQKSSATGYNKSHYGNIDINIEEAAHATNLLNDMNGSGTCPFSHAK